MRQREFIVWNVFYLIWLIFKILGFFSAIGN